MIQPKSGFFQKVTLVFFGLFLFFVLLETALRLGGVIFLALQEHRNAVSLREKGAYRILCLGESTTALGGEDSYPSQLEKILNGRNAGVTFSVINKGIPAIDTSYIVANLKDNLEKYKPDLVITMMGINDFGEYVSYRGKTYQRKPPLFKSLSIYRLGRLLWLHILTKNKKTAPKTPAQENMAGRSYSPETPDLYTEEALKKNIELNPYSDEAYMELGLFYLSRGRLVLGLFKRAVELKTKNSHAYIALGLWRASENNGSGGTVSEAEGVLRRAIEIDPRNDKAYFALGLLYADETKIPEAIAAFNKAVEINPRDDRAYGALAALYDESGDVASSEKNYKKAAQLRLQYYNPVTVRNYRTLKRILDERGVRYLCTQYPLRSIQPLKNIFAGEDRVIYVDNEMIFKKAIRERGYGRYFLDIFGGDFGHCSREGSRLLAENIADTIVKEIFRK